MDYLKPIETLEKSISTHVKVNYALAGLLAVSLMVVPYIVKEVNPVLVQTQSGVALAKTEPWKLSAARMETFAKAYLGSRFEWDEKTFEQKRKGLANISDPGIFSKLKDSMNAFEGLAKNQKARSYYVLESFIFANEEQKLEARMTRVLRIQDVAMATPLVIRISYVEAAITPDNPYGMRVSSLDERELRSN